jgi:hypothetical protein
MSDKYDATFNVNGDKRAIRVEPRSLADAHGLSEILKSMLAAAAEMRK